MTHNANALRAFVPSFTFPVPIYEETGDRIGEHAEKPRLMRYIREGLVTGHGKHNRIKRIRFVHGVREVMRKLRMVKPDDAVNIPIAGDVIVAYKDTRRKYRRSGLPKAFGPVRTVMADGHVLEEKVTPVEL